jgi:hypothetical protein
MGLLPRVLRLAVGVFILLALISLPTSRVDRNPGSALTPSIVWAGGSPDETLKPPAEPPPPKKAASFRVEPIADAQRTHRTTTRFTALKRWEIFFSVFRMFATRF